MEEEEEEEEEVVVVVVVEEEGLGRWSGYTPVSSVKERGGATARARAPRGTNAGRLRAARVRGEGEAEQEARVRGCAVIQTTGSIVPQSQALSAPF